MVRHSYSVIRGSSLAFFETLGSFYNLYAPERGRFHGLVRYLLIRMVYAHCNEDKSKGVKEGSSHPRKEPLAHEEIMYEISKIKCFFEYYQKMLRFVYEITSVVCEENKKYLVDITHISTPWMILEVMLGFSMGRSKK